MLGSLVAMPILIINMGGEMMYILNQRLTAQNIPEEKASKVLSDVIRTMYTPVFLEELFKPQEIYSAVSTKQIFDKLAHSSIMRLNKTSMDKLYDLMTMGVKFQLLQCAAPIQFLQVTLRHLEGLEKLVGTHTDVKALLQNAMSRCISLYSALTYGDWLLVQQTLYQFFYGKRVKVSLFLQQNMQTTTGMLILTNKGNLPYLTEKPGSIRYYENNKVVRTDYFATELSDKTREHDEVIDWTLPYGRDLYNRATAEDTHLGPSQIFVDAAKAFSRNPALHSSYIPEKNRSVSLLAEALKSASRPSAKATSENSAKAEISLLAELLGAGGSKDSKADDRPFKINLFPNAGFDSKNENVNSSADDKDDGNYEGNFIVFDIDATADAKTLARYMEDLDLKDTDYKAESKRGGGGDDADDLLDLMDSAK